MRNITFTYDQKFGSVEVGGRVRFYCHKWGFGYQIELLNNVRLPRTFKTIEDAVDWFFRPVYYVLTEGAWGRAQTLHGAFNEAAGALTKAEKTQEVREYVAHYTINGSYIDPTTGELKLEGGPNEPFK